jgi:hypothetical protein
VVIAHFSTSKAIAAAAGLFAFAVLMSVMVYDMLFAHPTDDRIKYGLNVWGLAIAGVCLIILMVFMVRAIRAAVASHGEALWIEDGRLRHADQKILDVATRDVTSVDLVRAAITGISSPWPPHVILMVLGLRDGKDLKLSVNGFVENREDVVVALRERLGLPAHDVVLLQGSL